MADGAVRFPGEFRGRFLNSDRFRSVAQSTADLISQLSSNLPEHMSIDQSLRQHEEKVRREQADEEVYF